MNRPYKITRRQMFMLLIQTQIGVSVLSLPYDVFRAASRDGWISVILAGIASQLIIIILWLISKRFPNAQWYEILQKTCGKWVGRLFSAAYFLYFCILGSMVLILYGLSVNVWLMPNTPTWILLVAMALLGSYLGKENLRIYARVYTFLSVILALLLAFLIYAIKDIHPLYVLPVGSSGIGNIMLGVVKSFLSLTGFELILLIYPFVQGNAGQKLKTASLANLFVIVYYVVATLVCFMFFSPSQISVLPEPVLYMIKAFNFTVLERVDLLFVSLWTGVVLTSFTSYLFMASEGLRTLAPPLNKANAVRITVAVCYVLAILPGQNVVLIQHLNTMLAPVTAMFLIGIPTVVLGWAMMFRKKEGISS
ncbi:MAG TPA: GerAB/ArcD/ProY family transporter [Bacillales bacterium]|nr:GerAB/ArcD/ProY family transporter [Bacillales bacterium]